ncbi:MAG: C4-type zinc ribbon domain-containing protein [Chitinispirillales bacterium]|jgi:predicted  nucleic acid-binding Zn-ribbon protein|nr:C4-type zinc ribbon domain-containing protein [Chitinispirillales bacterium]
MIQDLEYLVKLQEIDLKVREQELAKEQYPKAVADLEKRIDGARETSVATSERLARLASEVTTADEQVAKLRESLAKSQERLNSIQTNKEYDAVHKEIEAQKALLTSAEGRKTTLESDIEKGKAALEEAEKAYENAKAELQPQIDDLQAKIGKIDSVIAEIMAERAKISPMVSHPTMRTYDSIRKKKKSGRAVSMVNQEKTCGVCFMILQPQLCSEIRRGTKIILCESCGSMLIWDETAGS